jgi:hypothetical protein
VAVSPPVKENRPADTDFREARGHTMAKDEFTLRITRTGQIIIEMDGMAPERIGDLLRYFEDALGPVMPLEAEDGDDGRVRYLAGTTADDAVEEEAAEAEQQRRRLRTE